MQRILARSGVWHRAISRCCAPAASAVSSGKPLACRAFASDAGSKVLKTLQAEIKHEDEQYEQSKEVQKFLKSTDFTFADRDGDVNMCLERAIGDRVVKIEWQLTSPFDPSADMEGGDELPDQDATDFCVTVESKSTGHGLCFYCNTLAGEDHRYVIGNVKCFASTEEKDNIGCYNGPEFEDLDDKLQEAFDEYLGEVGMCNEVCDFIDAVALDKEQREYVRWLKTASTFAE